jgi:uncharacterized protein DUF5710
MARAYYGKPKPITESEWRSRERDRQYLKATAQGRVYLRVPFNERHEASRLGANFDVNRKCWYIPHGVRLAKFHWPQLSFPPPVRK